MNGCVSLPDIRSNYDRVVLVELVQGIDRIKFRHVGSRIPSIQESKYNVCYYRISGPIIIEYFQKISEEFDRIHFRNWVHGYPPF